MDMMNKTCAEHKCCTKKISWSSIITGAFVAIGLMILFKVFTLGIGLSMATKNEAGMLSLMVGSFIWLFIGSYITLFLAGWVTGLLAKDYTQHACHGILYGFLMWSVSLIICLTLEASAASAAGSMLSAFSKMFVFVSTQADTVHGAHKIGVAALSAFFILLAGALGSCFGAYFGIKYCKKDQPKTPSQSQSQPYQQQ